MTAPGTLQNRSLEAVSASVGRQTPQLIELNQQFWSTPEVKWKEVKSSQLFASALRRAHFSVQHGIDNLPTVVVGVFNPKGKFRVGLFGELDALPSDNPEVAFDGAAQKCGHNIIAISALGAGTALTEVAEDLDMAIYVYGCPAEEGGGGKLEMAMRGVFEGLHAGIIVHPSQFDAAVLPTLETSFWRVVMKGQSAHASAGPWNGKSAYNAGRGAEMLIDSHRYALRGSERISWDPEDTRGAPNLVGEFWGGNFHIRAANRARLLAVEDRVRRSFEGAAHAHDVSLDFTQTALTYPTLEVPEEIIAAYAQHAEAIGRPLTPIEQVIAAELLAATDSLSPWMAYAHPLIRLDVPEGVSIHQDGFAAAAGSETGNQAAIDGSLLMAQTMVTVGTSNARDALMARPCAAEASFAGQSLGRAMGAPGL